MAQDYLKILNAPPIVAWAKKHLKKQDRIVWYLKLIKEYPLTHPSENLIHYYSMNIPEIESFSPSVESEMELYFKFQEFEDQYLDKIKASSRLIPFNREDKSILYLGDDWHWFLLKRPSCREEGTAMGHCGNASGRTTDRLLSLRKVVYRAGRPFFEPHATFILLKDKKLGEMKGRQNCKPDAKYHPQILELLKSNFIKGIKGGGYLPENNFDLSDLSEESLISFMQDYSHKIEPYLIPIIENRKNPQFLISQRITKEKQLANCFNWIKNEKDLLKIALHSKVLEMRIAAIKRIENEEFLFEILNKRRDYSSKRAACRRIYDETLLEKIFDVYGKTDSEMARHCVVIVSDINLLRNFLEKIEFKDSIFVHLISKAPELIPEIFFKRSFTRHAKQVILLQCKDEDFLERVVLQDTDEEVQKLAISRCQLQKKLHQLLTGIEGRDLDLPVRIELVKHIWDKEFLIESLTTLPLSAEDEAELAYQVIDQIGFSSVDSHRDNLLEKLHHQIKNEKVRAYARFKMTNRGKHLVTSTSVPF